MRAAPDFAILRGVELLQLGFELGQFAVLDLRGALKLALAGLLLGFEAQGLDLLFQVTDAVDGLALLGPAGAQGRDLLANLRHLALDFCQALFAVGVGFALQCGALDFKRSSFALKLIDLGRHGADLDGQRRSGFVDQVDGLVGQKAVGDVAVRERGRGHDGRVLDAHVVVRLVALFQPAQDGDGVFDVGLADVDDLEAAFEGGVLLDVFAVLVQRGCADGPQLAARQRRLEHVAGVDGAFGRACADQRVELVDEQNNLAVAILRSPSAQL